MCYQRAVCPSLEELERSRARLEPDKREFRRKLQRVDVRSQAPWASNRQVAVVPTGTRSPRRDPPPTVCAPLGGREEEDCSTAADDVMQPLNLSSGGDVASSGYDGSPMESVRSKWAAAAFAAAAGGKSPATQDGGDVRLVAGFEFADRSAVGRVAGGDMDVDAATGAPISRSVEACESAPSFVDREHEQRKHRALVSLYGRRCQWS